MARIVALHGIGQQLLGPSIVCADWVKALRDGLGFAAYQFRDDNDLACAFWGDLFRPQGKAGGTFPYTADDATDPWEQQMLAQWWSEAARVESGVPAPDAETKGRTPRLVQSALNALSNSRFFAQIATPALLIGNLKQVYSYLHDDSMRMRIQQRVIDTVADDTRMVIGHSLGSVIAYEALAAHPEWPVRTLVTLGSPLGIRNLVFDLLRPSPANGVGRWPGSVERWINVADGGDIVALVKELQPLFHTSTNRVEDRLIYNGANAHDVTPYLTAVETGRGIRDGLAD